MLIVAYCHDSVNASARRGGLLPPHVAYLRSASANIRFAAAIANADGATLTSDKLIGSVIVVDVPSAAEAQDLLRDDPYAAGGIWDEMHLYKVGDPYGPWVDPSYESSSEPLYVTFYSFRAENTSCRESDVNAPGEHSIPQLNQKFGCTLLRIDTPSVSNAKHTRWQSMHFLTSKTLEDATHISAGVGAFDTKSIGEARSLTAAIPVAIGSWVGRSTF